MTRNTLETIAAILIRSFLAAVVALIFVTAVVAVGGESVYGLQARVTGLTPEQMPLLTTVFLLLIKCLSVTLFLFPWVSIRLYLRQTNAVDHRVERPCPTPG